MTCSKVTAFKWQHTSIELLINDLQITDSIYYGRFVRNLRRSDEAIVPITSARNRIARFQQLIIALLVSPDEENDLWTIRIFWWCWGQLQRSLESFFLMLLKNISSSVTKTMLKIPFVALESARRSRMLIFGRNANLVLESDCGLPYSPFNWNYSQLFCTLFLPLTRILIEWCFQFVVFDLFLDVFNAEITVLDTSIPFSASHLSFGAVLTQTSTKNRCVLAPFLFQINIDNLHLPQFMRS